LTFEEVLVHVTSMKTSTPASMKTKSLLYLVSGMEEKGATSNPERD